MKSKLFEQENYIEDLANKIADKIENDHSRRGYKTGYIFGFNDAKDAKLPKHRDIKIIKSDSDCYNSFWCSVFPASSGLAHYRYAYQDGYQDGYKFYLEYIKSFFDGYIGDKSSNVEK